MALRSQRQLRYLGLQFGHNLHMGAHLKYVIGRAEKVIAALGRLMPNIGGPKPGTRRLLGSVVHSIVLYAAPAWKPCIDKALYRSWLERVQRKVALRICSAYRTTSTKALQVIAGIIPIHLLVLERTYAPGANSRPNKLLIRETTIRQWQVEWNQEARTAQWTKILIREIAPWISRRHGDVGFYLTQFLTGHGRFNTYLYRMGLVDSDLCPYCAQMDTPEHTVFHCPRWLAFRNSCEGRLGRILTSQTVIPLMLQSRENWHTIQDLIISILQAKEQDARGVRQ